MASFKALNLESDDESDIEVDDTKEIQIEEALKLYQNALKFHADGPESFDKAAEAYQLLFESEIFKYPESQAELRYIELYGTVPDFDEPWSNITTGTSTSAGSLETGPSTLPQILHLSHKNYAQFRLEALIAKFDTFQVSLNQILVDAAAALEHFVNALDKDDSDLDLWRRTASVGQILDSKRVARFCLESVLDGDDEGLNGVLALPGLQESLAGELLRNLIKELQDYVSVLQNGITNPERRMISKMLRQRLHPYESLITRGKALRSEDDISKSFIDPPPTLLKAPSTWAELGEALVMQFNSEQWGTASASSGCPIAFDLNVKEMPSDPKAIDSAPQHSPLNPSFALITADSLPTTIESQFPGLDQGVPTAQPQIPSVQESPQPTGDASADQQIAVPDLSTTVLPSRKRSGESAGLKDGQEEGRTKSKRIRARDSNVDAADSRQAMIDANTRWEYEQQLNEFQAADDWMFETIGNLFEKVGIVGLDSTRNVRQDIQEYTGSDLAPSPPFDNGLGPLRHARSDIHAFVNNFDDQLAQVLLQNSESLDFSSNTSSTGVDSAFAGGGTISNTAAKLPNLSKDNLRELLEAINSRSLLTREANWVFLEALLRPGGSAGEASSYLKFSWPENLKTIVVRNLVHFDADLFERASLAVANSRTAHGSQSISDQDNGLAEMIQTMFELHLDVYCLIKLKDSGVDHETIIDQGDRLQRWSTLAREALQLRAERQAITDLADQLGLRFLWATCFFVSADDEIGQEHVVECLNDLKRIFVSVGEPTIQLPNNAIMPELSVATLEQVLSRSETGDFFSKVANYEQDDPAALIETLEPLLEQLRLDQHSSDEPPSPPSVAMESRTSQKVIQFLKNSDTYVQMKLWQRLRNAYIAIDYQPMVLYCYFRMISIVLDEIKSPSFVKLEQAERQIAVIRRLQVIKILIKNLYTTLQKADNSMDYMECIDESGLKSAVLSLADVLQIIQVFNIAEDSIRVGQAQPPLLDGGLPAPYFHSVATVFHEMQIQIWTVMYSLLQEAISQNAELFPTPTEDKFDFLRTVHRNLGLRKMCGCCDRDFVRLLKNEFSKMAHVDGYDSEQAQVLYDLFGLNCFLNPSYELIEHDCQRDAFIDRRAALQSVNLLLLQASKLPIKELVKHPIKDTIDKVHGAIVRKRPTEAIQRNRDVCRIFLRSPINPLDLYGCLTGSGSQLGVTYVPKADSVLASKGWYFLMGHMALTKFRSLKRTGPTPTEDVDIAIAFFMQALESTMEHWETWFRLAQAYDTKIEENVVWSAEKLNNNMTELVALQRCAIHCYTMATALANRSADLAFETSSKMTELYGDFATRLYSSSREPFSMAPFAVTDVEIKLVSTHQGIMKEKLFQPLGLYTAWKLAHVFFKKALAGRPDQWMLHFMIGKCLAKMHHADATTRRNDKAPTGTQVVQAFVRALELLPDKDKKDSRDSKREPLLEPHYKLVSVVHKLVMAGSIDLSQAREALSYTHYATRDQFPESKDAWVPYVLAVLKHIRVADKSHWHHRIVARAAHIIYYQNGHGTDSADQDLAALGAKHELTQQMFTKTMVLQVWRPETERAGRHFVYTTRYTRFFVKILTQLKDRMSLEALARRLRRRIHDLFEPALVWHETCTAYLSLLRSHAELSEGLETSTFSNITHETFAARKELLEKWMQAQPQGASPALDALREVQELKKINQGLMKIGVIDDLIGDAYAYLFNVIGKTLLEEDQKAKQEEEARRAPPPAASPPRNPRMSLISLMNTDSGDDEPTAPRVLVPVIPRASSPRGGPPVRRKIGVGRREIRTCAEACFPKAGSQNGSSIKGSTPAGARVRALLEDSQQHVAGDASADTSAPGSIHDSADESELSELEEEEDSDREEIAKEQSVLTQRRPMFPGLASINQADSAVDADGSDGGFQTAEEEPQQEKYADTIERETNDGPGRDASTPASAEKPGRHDD